VTERRHLPAALRRAVAGAVVLALLVLPILSRGALAHQTHEPVGILCSQTELGDPGPGPASQEDCLRSCALAQGQILPPLPKPVIGRMSLPSMPELPPQGSLIPRTVVVHRHIRGPPASLLA
jgi:hypothetical protein